MRGTRRPSALTLYVTAVAVTALAGSGALVAVSGPLMTSLVMIATFSAALAVLHMLPIPIARGRELDLFYLDEALLLPLILMLDPKAALVAASMGWFAGLLLARGEPLKLVFNLAQRVLSLLVALAIVAAFAGPAPGLTGMGVGAAVAGLAAGFAINQLLVAGVLARAGGGRSTRELLLDDLATRSLIILSSIALGLLLLAAAVHEPWLLLGAMVPALVVHAAFRSMAERSHEVAHLMTLREYGTDLLETLDLDGVAHGLVRRARDIVGADYVELRIDGIDRAYLSGHRVEGAVDVASLPVVPARRASDLSFDLRGRADLRATLLVRSARPPATGASEDGPFSRRERLLLETLVRQAQIGLDNALLYQRVRQKNRLLSMIFENSTEGLLVVSGDGRVVSWNPAMERMTGMSARDIVGSPIQLLGPELTTFLESEQAGTLTTSMRTLTGADLDVQLYYAPVPLEDATDGEETLHVAVVNDITLRKEAERLKDDFVATVSHELRTPLTSIKGFVDTMSREDIVVSPTRFPMFLKIMRDQTERLDRLISDLLDASRLESGPPLQLEIEPVELHPLVEQVVELFRVARPDAHVRIDWPLESDGMVALADPHRLHQILTNLLENAWKHAGEHGEIRIHGSRTDAARMQLAVQDAGPGVPLHERERIFERFYITRDSVTRNGGGAGLGLYICRRLAAAMDATLSCVDVDEGAAFVLDLPSAAPTERERLTTDDVLDADSA